MLVNCIIKICGHYEDFAVVVVTIMNSITALEILYFKSYKKSKKFIILI